MSEKIQQPHNAELPESFTAEFNSAKSLDVRAAMVNLGGFVFEAGSVPNEDTVSCKGRRSDGTTIEITFMKGESYRPPAAIETENGSENQQ